MFRIPAFIYSYMSTITDYQIAIDHVEKLVERRQATTSFYLSVNTAIAAAIGLLINDSKRVTDVWGIAALLLLFLVGIIACVIWRSLLLQYKVLLDWWYTRIREMEVSQPNSAKLFTEEFRQLYTFSLSKKENSKPKIGMTKLEVSLSWLFTALYLLFIAGILLLNLT